jgi:hypothetical protein
MWLVEGSGGAVSGPLSTECRLSRRLALSSLQLVPHRPLKARPVMILVFKASTSSPTGGLLFEPQCKRIATNVFSGDADSAFGSQDL